MGHYKTGKNFNALNFVSSFYKLVVVAVRIDCSNKFSRDEVPSLTYSSPVIIFKIKHKKLFQKFLNHKLKYLSSH